MITRGLIKIGIAIVGEIGPRKAIRMYSKDPTAFRDLLL
jgi:hypothetical protein